MSPQSFLSGRNWALLLSPKIVLYQLCCRVSQNGSCDSKMRDSKGDSRCSYSLEAGHWGTSDLTFLPGACSKCPSSDGPSKASWRSASTISFPTSVTQKTSPSPLTFAILGYYSFREVFLARMNCSKHTLLDQSSNNCFAPTLRKMSVNMLLFSMIFLFLF